MGTCKYCDKSVPLAHLKSHYKEHNVGPNVHEDLVTPNDDFNGNILNLMENEDAASSKENENVQENCISSSSSPLDRPMSIDDQNSVARNISFKDGKSVDNSGETDGDTLTLDSDLADKSVDSSSESHSEADKSLTMVIVKRELLDLEDSVVLNIKKEVDPLGEDSVISDQPQEGSTRVTKDESSER